MIISMHIANIIIGKVNVNLVILKARSYLIKRTSNNLEVLICLLKDIFIKRMSIIIKAD